MRRAQRIHAPRPAWRSAWFIDGFCLGVLAGVIGYGVFVNIVMRIWG